jgi:hypothetical protein
MGWQLVVTFREMRRHLGVETQRQLSHQVNRGLSNLPKRGDDAYLTSHDATPVGAVRTTVLP